MQVLPHLSAALTSSPAGGGTVLRVSPLAVGAGVLDSPKPPLCKGRWHPACYARWMTEGLLPRLRCRGRAELGTSQQSLERHAFLARRDVSRASGCFSRVGMPSAARARQGHNWAKRIGEFVSAANSPILFSCLSPIPSGRSGGRPLHGRRHLIRHSAGCDTPNAAFYSSKR